MKRKAITLILIVACFLLESTVFQKLKIGSVCPNLMVILTASFGFMRGQREGMYIGLASGFLMDLFWGGTIGFYMIIFLAIGYANGSFKRLFYDDDLVFPIVLIAASDLVYGLATYVCLFMLQGDFAFDTYLYGIILPELAYTILVTLVLYQIILKINKLLEEEEQRSASRFV